MNFVLICLMMMFMCGNAYVHQGNLCIGIATEISFVQDLCKNSDWTGKKTTLNEYKGMTRVTGNLVIWGDDDLKTLDGLDDLLDVGGDLVIGDNTRLTTVLDLNNVGSIGGRLSIWHNENLETLLGLDNVVSIGNLYITDNDKLKTLAGLDNIVTIDGDLLIGGNDGLESLDGLKNVASIGGNLEIENNENLQKIRSFNPRGVSIGGDINLLWSGAKITRIADFYRDALILPSCEYPGYFCEDGSDVPEICPINRFCPAGSKRSGACPGAQRGSFKCPSDEKNVGNPGNGGCRHVFIVAAVISLMMIL